eukprot:Skav225983  [mRNA]  locus=scaffold5683:95518:96420:+ [translate_table: standard]
MRRKGLILTNLLLSEESVVSFLVEAQQERKEAEGNRLSFSKVRSLLKRQMITETQSRHADSFDGEWQPLSVWELRGYDTAKIEEQCPCETHSVLGKTYKLVIHAESDATITSEVERRLVTLENAALQKKSSAQPAPGQPVLELDEALEPKESKSKRKAGLTLEEREENKRAKAAQRKLEVERKVETAAAVKYLPQLKAVEAKLKDKVEKLGTQFDDLSGRVQGEVKDCLEDLAEVVSVGTKVLSLAAAGKSLTDLDVPWKKDKDLQSKVKTANSCLRALQEFVRSNKENAAPKTKRAKKA